MVPVWLRLFLPAPPARSTRSARLCFWRWLLVGGYAAGLFACSSLPGSRLPVPPERRLARRWHRPPPRWLLSDKVLHALAYGLGTALLCRALHSQAPARPLQQIALASFLGACGYGLLDERHQAHVPQRTATVADGVANGVGAALAAWGWQHWAPRWPWLR